MSDVGQIGNLPAQEFKAHWRIVNPPTARTKHKTGRLPIGRRLTICPTICTLVLTSTLNAQCVMCQRTAAAQQWERAQVMNTGIFVLLIPPVLILAAICYVVYKRRES